MKLVSFRPVVRKDGNATCGYTAHMTSKPDNRDSDWRGEESRQWVKLTDHEAALAELMAECEKRGEGLVFQSQGWEEANERLATLLSGLEALAGEWKKEPAGQYEYDQGHAEGMHDCGNELSYRLAECRTITNSAKGGA